MINQFFSQPFYISNFNSNLIKLSYSTSRKWESNTITSKNNRNELNNKSYEILIKELFKYTNKIISKDHKIELLEIWANEYLEKDFQEQHTHPGSHFSFTIIHKCPPGSGRLKFYNPYDNYGISYEEIFCNYYDFVIEPIQEENTIIIWPSYMRHMVTPGSNKTKRITYSGNIKIIV